MAKNKTGYFTFSNLDYKEQSSSIHNKLITALRNEEMTSSRKVKFINHLLQLSSNDFNETIAKRFDDIFNLKQLEENHYIILPEAMGSFSFLQIDTGKGMLREVSFFNLKEHYVAAISQTLPENKYTLSIELYEDDNFTAQEVFTAGIEEHSTVTKMVKNAFNEAERTLLSQIACHHKN